MRSAASLLRVWVALLGGGLALAAGGLVAGCSGAHEPAQQAERTAGRSPQVGRALINVPAILGKPIDVLRQRLESGVPLPAAYQEGDVYACLDPTTTDSVLTCRSGNLLLLACYDIRSRQVHDLLLLGRQEDSLMQQAALRPNATDYLVLPVFQAKRMGALLGLRVVDTRAAHN